MRIEFSYHARMRMAQMGLDPELVRSVIADPDLTMPNDASYPAGRKYVGRGIVAAVTPAGMVMTVLWHGAHGRTNSGGAAWSEEAAA